VVIVGAGFGGLVAAKTLANAPVDVTVIDRQNYHLFQPLLYQVATAGLSPSEIAWPVRRILRDQPNTRVILGEVTGVDPLRQTVMLDEESVPYDFLILATGVRHAYFGHDDWEPYAPGLKELDDATRMRRRILMAFERAELEADERERKRLLTFAIVGGGPTGVEMAGAMVELARKALAADFRHIDPRSARIVLIEAGPRLLATFHESLSRFARKSLEHLGVEIRLNQRVTGCDAQGVTVDQERLPAATVIWAAGVAASPAAKWLEVEHDSAGRVVVGPDLSVPGLANVFVIGDTALVKDKSGQPIPGMAPGAKQEGRYVAKLIAARIAGKPKPAPFRYRHWGSLATIGRRSAVIDFGIFRVKGALAWWLWGFAHIYFLISMRNRLTVAIQWLWSYLTFERGARLITGTENVKAKGQSRN
jgi:NADH dehydrogenase FAD-containing subunit